MNAHISELLVFGLIAVVIGIFVLMGIVRELIPTNQRKWLLGTALGLGIIAFSLKIIFIVTFSTFPTPILEHLSTKEYKPRRLLNTEEYQPTPTFQKTAYVWKTLPNVAPAPLDNPSTPEKIVLGKQLFFDKRLSADNSLSCASCHDISSKKGGGDGLPSSLGIHGQQGQRNAPTVLNAAFQRVLFWDGRAHSLEEQAKGPLVNSIEMGMPSLEAVQERVRAIPEYQQAFPKVFTERPAITADTVAKAIAAYERTLITPNSAYDRFVKGDSNALSAAQLRGMALFESTGCIMCHSGANFSGAGSDGNKAAYRLFPSVINTEYEAKYHFTEDLGAARPTSEQGVWRIPSLRNVSRTAPYFHNGSVDTLEEAVRIMARVQLNKKLSNNVTEDKSLYWSSEDRQLLESNNQALSDDEVKDIVTFLTALEGEVVDMAVLDIPSLAKKSD